MGLTSLVALVSESPAVPLAELAPVAAAIQKQCVRDAARFWEVSAALSVFASLGQVPPGYWPVVIRDDIGRPEGGIHLDDQGQPFSLVVADEEWTVTASHEILEMLVDPFGNRMIAGDSPEAGQGRVEFLLEIADPCADPGLAYTCDGVAVSDFCTPRYFDPVGAPGVQYSMTGAVKGPREVLRGGYLTWRDPVGDQWWQKTWFGGGEAQTRKMDPLDITLGTIRTRVDCATERAKRGVGGRADRAGAGRARRPSVATGVTAAAKGRERALRKAIERVVARSRAGTG